MLTMTTKSKKYDMIKYYYDNGMWNIARVKMAVKVGAITKAEYKTITGEDYQE